MDVFDPDQLDDDSGPGIGWTGGVVEPIYTDLPTGTPAAYTSGQALAKAKPETRNATNALLEEMRSLTKAKGARQPTVMDRVMAGLTADLGKPSRNKGVALLDALFSSAKAAYDARKGKDDSKEQFDMRYKLYGAERQAQNDAETSSDRRRRTNAYEASVYGGRSGRGARGIDPVQREKWISEIMKENRYRKALDADDGQMVPGKKLTPEQRADLERKVDEEENRLRSLHAQGLPQGSNGVTSQPPGTPAPQRPTTTPGPTPPAVPKTAPTKPQAALPQGVDRNSAIAQTQAALEAARGNPTKEQAIRERARTQYGLDF